MGTLGDQTVAHFKDLPASLSAVVVQLKKALKSAN
jgi:hypothetical protein